MDAGKTRGATDTCKLGPKEDASPHFYTAQFMNKATVRPEK